MTPVAELELYSELAIISETPVPLPESHQDEKSSAPRQRQPNDKQKNLKRTHR